MLCYDVRDARVSLLHNRLLSVFIRLSPDSVHSPVEKFPQPLCLTWTFLPFSNFYSLWVYLGCPFICIYPYSSSNIRELVGGGLVCCGLLPGFCWVVFGVDAVQFYILNSVFSHSESDAYANSHMWISKLTMQSMDIIFIPIYTYEMRSDIYVNLVYNYNWTSYWRILGGRSPAK